MNGNRKNQLAVVLSGVLWLGLAGIGWAQTTASFHSWDVQQVFAPVGFDDNDNVQIVLDGLLPDACTKVLEPSVEFDLESGLILIGPRAMIDERPCRPWEVAVSQVVNLGPLPFGEYDVQLIAGSATAALAVAESDNAGPDDVLFAQVEYAWPNSYLDHDGVLHLRAELDGYFTSSCQSWDEVQVAFEEGVYVVRPILREHEGPCLPVLQEFSVFAELPVPEEEGRFLLHVRSQNGNSYNHVFEF